MISLQNRRVNPSVDFFCKFSKNYFRNKRGGNLFGDKVIFHVVFALKYSRYHLEEIKKKKDTGYITRTFPFIEGREEEILLEEFMISATNLKLKILAFNFCGDHVHVLLSIAREDLNRTIGLWKGKTAYHFNRKINPEISTIHSSKSDGTKKNLWSKSFYSREVEDPGQIERLINYINNNRQKHGLPPLSSQSMYFIEKSYKLSHNNN